jgi:hypothetical protein
VCFLEKVGANLDRHSSRDLAHRRQERKRTVVQLHRFVGYRLNVVANERLSQRSVGSEMEIGEQQLPRTKQIVFRGNRFFDLDDHFRAVVDREC